MIDLTRGFHVVTTISCLALPGCFMPIGMGTSGDRGESSGGGEDTTRGDAPTGEGGSTTTTTGPGEVTGGVVSASAAASEASEPGSASEDSGTLTGSEGPVCGNGARELGEDCDDGADNGVDQPCTPECRLATCGDGYICTECSPAEECDDANPISGDGCEPGLCTVGVCGNRVIEKYEECDPPNVDCSVRCTKAVTRLFLTNQRYIGTIGGVAAADRICRKLGRDYFTPKRQFVAWLSGEQSAAERIGISDWPYALATEAVVAANTAALLAGPLNVPIDVTELGAALEPDTGGCGPAGVWTGTAADGSKTGLDCGGWSGSNVTASVGDFTKTGDGWSHEADCMSCDSTALHFYCVEKAMP